jgi:hypothetical protein
MGSWTGESLTAGTFSPLLFSEDAKRRAADHAFPPGAMRPRSCNALTVFRVADWDRVNFAVFESAQQHIAAQQFGLKLIAVLQVREQPVRFRSSRKAPQSTLVLCQVVTVCPLLAIESGSSANLTLGLLHVCSSSTPDSELVR